MTAPTIVPVFADALRAALVDHVATARVRRRRLVVRRGVTAALGLGLVGGGVAIAAGLLPFPGSDAVTTLGTPVTVTRTGTSTVELGPPPADATNLELSLTCLSAGTFTFPDGGSMTCTEADARSGTGTAFGPMPLAPGQHTATITTTPDDARWTLTVGYSHRETTAWETNANGDTYGVINDQGEPDLVAVTATNGRDGYVYRDALDGPMPTSPTQALRWQAEDAGRSHTVPVYESDGVTQVGVFEIGGLDRSGPSAPQPTTPRRTP